MVRTALSCVSPGIWYVGSAKAAEFEGPFAVLQEALGVANDVDQKDFGDSEPDCFLGVRRPLMGFCCPGQKAKNPVGLCQLKSSSRVVRPRALCGRMGSSIVAVLAETGARVLWLVHSRGCSCGCYAWLEAVVRVLD